jgi:Ca2+-binding RTX toxin-like protein
MPEPVEDDYVGVITGDDGDNWLQPPQPLGPYIFYGLDGRDSVGGSNGADWIEGGRHDDFLAGQRGADTFVYEIGDGHDEIYESGSDAATDVVAFGAGVSPSDIRLETTDRRVDVVVMFQDMPIITLDGQGSLELRVVEQLAFEDGTSWTMKDIIIPQIGTALRDRINGGFGGMSSDNMIYGLAGNDELNAGDGDDTVFGGGGADILQGGRGVNFLDAGSGDDRVYGGQARDVIHGGNGQDLVEAGSGTDRVVGGAGNDTLTGGLGNDFFAFRPGSGHDLIEDFGEGADRIDLRPYDGITSRGQIGMSEQEGDTVLALLGGDTITLHNVDASEVLDSDILI